MPVKTHKRAHKKYSKDYAKVYWPYIPLFLVIGATLWLAQPLVTRSQRGVLAYSTNVTNADLITETNKARRAGGDPTLIPNPQLAQAAQAKAEDMVARNYWSHMTPDNKTPWIFIDQAGYKYQKAGENLAYGFGTSTDVVTGWLNSPPHKANLLDADFTEVGFGIAKSPNYQGSGPETVVVAFYATPGLAPVPQATSGLVAGFSNVNQFAKDVTASISKGQALTGGRAPWITFALGLLIGIALGYLVLKHSLRIHRARRTGERFIIQHPLLDAFILALVAFCAILIQSVGSVR